MYIYKCACVYVSTIGKAEKVKINEVLNSKVVNSKWFTQTKYTTMCVDKNTIS